MTLYPTVENVLKIGRKATGKEIEIRDLGLLLGALERPAQTLFGQDAYPTEWDKAAALLHSFTRNHALIDGNKRTGIALAVSFLLINDVIQQGKRDLQVGLDVALDVAKGDVEDVALIAMRLKEWLA